MDPNQKLRAPELLRPRLEVLKSGLQRLEHHEEEGRGTVRRIGKVLLHWAIAEELKKVEKAAFALVGAKDDKLLKRGRALAALLDEVVYTFMPGGSRQFVVLAVEDNPDDQLLLELGLAGPDRTVHMVASLAEAEAVLGMEDVALLVLDLCLPDGDGRGFIAKVREQEKYQDLTILMLSGKSGPDVMAECLALGATAVFDKPLDPTTLGTAVSSGLHREAKKRLATTTDPLTHLLNRTSIRELWDRWSFPEPSSISLIGIDQFRALENRYDHEVVDKVIAAVGILIRDSLPRGFVGARWEESQFLVLCPGHGLDSAMKPLEEILSDIRGLEHLDPSAETFRVTTSGGVSEIQLGSTFANAVEVATELLEGAMEAGGNALVDETQPEEAVTVLFAEDDMLSAAMLQHRLEKEGFNVLHFPDGAEALDGALSNRVDLAILDVKMPGMDGFELLERLRKVPAYYELPIIMLTSMGREEDVARGFDLGADDYMVKPFSPVEVLARVRRLLRR